MSVAYREFAVPVPRMVVPAGGPFVAKWLEMRSLELIDARDTSLGVCCFRDGSSPFTTVPASRCQGLLRPSRLGDLEAEELLAGRGGG